MIDGCLVAVAHNREQHPVVVIDVRYKVAAMDTSRGEIIEHLIGIPRSAAHTVILYGKNSAVIAREPVIKDVITCLDDIVPLEIPSCGGIFGVSEATVGCATVILDAAT